MKVETFLLERNQSLHENSVRFNLTESGVHPYSLAEILTSEMPNVEERGRLERRRRLTTIETMN